MQDLESSTITVKNLFGKSILSFRGEEVMFPLKKVNLDLSISILEKMGLLEEFFNCMRDEPNSFKVNISEFFKLLIPYIKVPSSFETAKRMEWQANEPYSVQQYIDLVCITQLQTLFSFTDINIVTITPMVMWEKPFEQVKERSTFDLTIKSKEEKEKDMFREVLEKLSNHDFKRDDCDRNIVKKLYYVAANTTPLMERKKKIGDRVLNPTDMGITVVLVPYDVEEAKFIFGDFTLLCREMDIEPKDVSRGNPIHKNMTSLEVLKYCYPLFCETIEHVTLGKNEYQNIFDVAIHMLKIKGADEAYEWMLNLKPYKKIVIREPKYKGCKGGLELSPYILSETLFKLHN